MTGSFAKPIAENCAETVLTLHVAFGLCPMVSVAAGSADLRKAHCVAGNQACCDVVTVNLRAVGGWCLRRVTRSLRGWRGAKRR